MSTALVLMSGMWSRRQYERHICELRINDEMFQKMQLLKLLTQSFHAGRLYTGYTEIGLPSLNKKLYCFI